MARKAKPRRRKVVGRKARRRRKVSRRVVHRRSRFPWGKLWFVLLLAAVIYVVYLDFSVRQQFEGKRWALPARVYARPLELFPGKQLSPASFAHELEGLQYRFVRDPRYPGEVARKDDVFVLISRPFSFVDGAQPAQEFRVGFDGDRVSALFDLSAGKPGNLTRLDPKLIGILYPTHKEDRILVKLEDVPNALMQMLIALEDRHFFSHHGLAPRAIARAIVADLRAGRLVQGGSTLTQQLVKNFFLSNERTFSRKLNEAIMALLVEGHYSKQEILEAYFNEVYLGQDGQRAIHGFGLASQFYFERAMTELTLDRMALLVGLVKGASYYDPRRHPERAKARRNLVLKVAAERGVISEHDAQQAMQRPLGVVGRRPASANRYPGFMDLVRRQLHRDYRDEDLTSDGLQIFTTLDPWVQDSLEEVFTAELKRLDTRLGFQTETLQAAGVVTAVATGEVLALAGGRDPRYSGFNRALDARRPIGSIVKPAVYLAALRNPERFTLATPLDDSPLTVRPKYGKDWTPQNYDHEFHGHVPLFNALAHSYNVATARLGMSIGLSEVIGTLKRMGLRRESKRLPSLLLGAIDLSPLEVTQLYQTLAGGGFRSPLRAIRAVLAADGVPLQRYPVTVEQAFEPGPVYLINVALQQVVRHGTGRGVGKYLPAELNVAGKTGTTDDLRDSWFAGFSGDRLAVIWLGRDDNQTMGLTGSSGALPVWGAFMRAAGAQALELTPAPSISYAWIDASNGLLSTTECPDAVRLPFLSGSEPAERSECKAKGGPLDWLRHAL